MKDGDSMKDSLSQELEEALAKYAAVEPRAGLEERILANLGVEQVRVRHRTWWNWSFAMGLAVVVVLALALARRSFRPGSFNPGSFRPVQAAIKNHPPTSTRSLTPPETKLSSNGEQTVSRQGLRPGPRVTSHRSHPAAAIADLPKLEQFPSPQPLSRQEKLLADYVAEHHKQAVLLARVWMAELKQDLAEEMAAASASRDDTLSESPANQETGR
jgi:hypothetical protein